jgi:histidinol dehydrogenase
MQLVKFFIKKESMMKFTDYERSIEKDVRDIIKEVKETGNAALCYYSKKFDNKILNQNELLLDVKDFESELQNIPKEVLDALKKAKYNIENYHKKQFENIKMHPFKYNQDDFNITEKISVIDRAGVYVPGGLYSYPSTVLMTVLPAKCAGVKEILVSTPFKNLTSLVKAALYLSGADKVLCVGGAQAIAAMAFGTESIKKVDIIVGPGNAFVTEAKRQVFGKVGIDMLAGPSDVLIYADDSSNVDWIVADMHAQCEHDLMAKAFFVCQDSRLLDEVKSKILPKFLDRMKFVKKENIYECADFINENAPEHLEILSDDKDKCDALLKLIKHAGAIFVGKYSSVALGDYILGPSHTLPTDYNAKFSSGLSVSTFLKKAAVMSVDKNFIVKNSKYVEDLANQEGLKYHAESINKRV